MKTVSSAPFSHYDTVDYLQDEQDITAYLNAELDDDDPALIAAAHADIARACNTLITQGESVNKLLNCGQFG